LFTVRAASATVTIALAALLASVASAADDELAADEDALFFPTSARLDESRQNWVVPIRGWVYEPDDNRITRAALERAVRLTIGVGSQNPMAQRIRRQVGWFAVDNERGKQLSIRLGDGLMRTSPPTGADGHFNFEVSVPRGGAERLAKDGWLTFSTIAADGRQFRGRAQLIQPHGVTVLSDVDDTIKISAVQDRLELLRNTFAREPKATAGAAAAFRAWRSRGAKVHFLSGSPWHLYPLFDELLASKDFPAASFDLRQYRIKNITQLYHLADTVAFKTAVIKRLLKQFPQRSFVMIGDSGQHDPEIYAAAARAHPQQVIGVFIRKVNGDQEQRFAEAFEGVDVSKWQAFDHYEEIEERVAALIQKNAAP
jgi:phosphoserine phosphatase